MLKTISLEVTLTEQKQAGCGVISSLLMTHTAFV